MPRLCAEGEASAGGASPGVPQRLVSLYCLALSDLKRGHNIDAALKVLAMLARVGVKGAEA